MTDMTGNFHQYCSFAANHKMPKTPEMCEQVLEISIEIQYNLNGSNTDGSFTVDDSNSLFSPNKILQIAQENKYLGIFFSYFIIFLHVVCTH